MYRSKAAANVNERGLQDTVAIALALAFLLVAAISIIGNYEFRLASVHGDNGAVFYSYLYEHTAEFARDAFGAPGVHWLWGSICFWGPVLAHKYLGLDPRIPDYLFYLLQIVLSGLSIFLLTYVVARSWWTAFASMGLAIVLQPWTWNLAAYPSSLAVPLYTTLAQAMATLVGVAFLTRRWDTAWGLAVLTAIVHPVIVCYLLAMLATWMWLNRAEWRIWTAPSTLLKFAVLVALCGAPFLVQAGFTEALLSPREHWESVSKHMHSVPWSNFPSVFHDLEYKTFGFLLVLVCCWPKLIELPVDRRRFLLAAAMGTLLLGAIQIVGIELKLANVALTMGLRAFSNFVLFAWPFAFTFLFSREVLKRFYVSFALILLALTWGRMEGGIPILHILLFGLAVSWPERFAPQRRCIYFATLALLPLPLIDLNGGGKIFLLASHGVSEAFYLLALLVSVVVADLLTLEWAMKPLRGLAAIGLLVFALLRAHEMGAATWQPANHDLYDTEIWARDHTSPGTMFMTEVGWRTLAQRPAAMLSPDLTEEVYTPFRSIRDRNEFFFRLYGIGDKWRSMGVADIGAASWAGYSRLKTRDFAALSGKIGAPFLVRTRDEPALNFPIVYQNATYRIYQVAPLQKEI